MDIEAFREYCLSLPYVTEKMPFTGLRDSYSRDVLCFYIGSKWFCFVNIEIFDRCCLKSTPEEAEELRLQYEGIRPAWHMNKRMWNDVYFNQDVPDSRIKELVRQSYNLVYKSKFVPTVFAARQFVNHGHVTVNGKKVNIPSYMVKVGDVIEVREKSKSMAMVVAALESQSRETPSYLEVDNKKMSAKYTFVPKFDDVPYAALMEPNLVIEFYSR